MPMVSTTMTVVLEAMLIGGDCDCDVIEHRRISIGQVSNDRMCSAPGLGV